jgi:Family of unknown function (DUF6152)
VNRGLYPFALVAAAWCGNASAHHSISSVYDGARQVTVEGRVTEFQFVNPHPILIIDAAVESPEQPWRLEMDNRFELSEIGMSAGTFKLGDRVVVTGSLSRTQPQSLYIRRLDRPADGFSYEQVGSRPRINLLPQP